MGYILLYNNTELHDIIHTEQKLNRLGTKLLILFKEVCYWLSIFKLLTDKYNNSNIIIVFRTQEIYKYAYWNVFYFNY